MNNSRTFTNSHKLNNWVKSRSRQKLRRKLFAFWNWIKMKTQYTETQTMGSFKRQHQSTKFLRQKLAILIFHISNRETCLKDLEQAETISKGLNGINNKTQGWKQWNRDKQIKSNNKRQYHESMIWRAGSELVQRKNKQVWQTLTKFRKR